MSNNKSNSPFFAIGQGINNLLDYQMIAAAGAPRNFLGLAIGNVGSHISRLDFSEMVKSDKEKREPEQIVSEITSKGIIESGDTTVDKDGNIVVKLLDLPPIAPPGGYNKKVNVTNDATGGGGNLPAYKKAYAAMPDEERAAYEEKAKKAGFNSGYEFYVNDQKNLSPEAKAAKESVRDYAKKYLPEGVTFDVNNPDHVKGYEKSEFYNSIGITGGKSNIKPPGGGGDGDGKGDGGGDSSTPDPNKGSGSYYYGKNYVDSFKNLFNWMLPEENIDKNVRYGEFDGMYMLPDNKNNNKTFKLKSTPQSIYTIDNTPVTYRLKPEILKIIEDARYKRKGKDDTKLHRIGYFLRSPFYQTKNKPYKLLSKVAETPYDAFSGLLPNGKNPAIQAYNAVIESENYRRKVENEFDEDLTKQVTSLDVDLSGSNITGQQRQDLLDLSLNNKKQLSEAFQEYADGKMNKAEYEMLKSNLLAEVNTLSSDLGLIKTKAQDYLNKKDNIDLAASNPLYADFFETAIRNPDSIRIVEIDGKKYFKGTTNAGQDFKIEVGAISNGDASFLLTEKADATSYVKNALSAMKGYVVETQTATGFGEKQLQDNTQMVDGKLVKSKIRTIGENSLIANLKQNPDNIRSLLAQYRGINYEGYQTLINQDIDGDGMVSTKEIQQNENMLLGQLAEELYDEFVAPQYNPQTRTTQRNTTRGGGGGGRGTAAERNRALLQNALAQLPTVDNKKAFESVYGTYIDPKFKFTVKENKEGVLSVFIGQKPEESVAIPLNDPNFKSRISQYTRLPNYLTNIVNQNYNTGNNTGGDGFVKPHEVQLN